MLGMANQRHTPVDTSIASTYLERYKVDRRSVFVGNLPNGIHSHDIRGLFEKYGSVVNVEIVERPSVRFGNYGPQIV
jgi:RNA recognition motif-containing protein